MIEQELLQHSIKVVLYTMLLHHSSDTGDMQLMVSRYPPLPLTCHPLHHQGEEQAQAQPSSHVVAAVAAVVVVVVLLTAPWPVLVLVLCW